MQCVVYVNGRIVKWYNGTRKNCQIYQQGAVEGLEAAGCRLHLSEETSMWHGWTPIGKPVLVFIWEGK